MKRLIIYFVPKEGYQTQVELIKRIGQWYLPYPYRGNSWNPKNDLQMHWFEYPSWEVHRGDDNRFYLIVRHSGFIELAAVSDDYAYLWPNVEELRTQAREASNSYCDDAF